VLAGGSLKCWGSNASGALGVGNTRDRGGAPGDMGKNFSAVNLGSGHTVVGVAAGAFHTCALLDDATAKCWGQNFAGQLGLGDSFSRGGAPGEMGGNLPAIALGAGRTVTSITAGADHSCALLDDRQIKCWGSNQYGQLGITAALSRGAAAGEMGDALPEVRLGQGRSAKAVVAGSGHTCALLDNDQVKCWGRNDTGQLGLGDRTNRGAAANDMGDNLPPVMLGSGLRALALSAGLAHTCALLDTHAVKCWGGNGGGFLGLSDTVDRGDDAGEMGDSLPAIDVGVGRRVLQVAASANHTCVLLDDGRLKCWGGNSWGQLGQGDIAFRGDGPNEMGDALVPIDLGPASLGVGIWTGTGFACARLVDGQRKCWGQNAHGQLGLGDVADRGDDPNEMGTALPAIDLTP
jgi:alpha-tubulin suppressor-like RCC1 family protein